MCNLPESLLVAPPIDRYLINSPMLPQPRRYPDGGATISVENASRREAEANWLPAPSGPF
jgi:hypothetical protein